MRTGVIAVPAVVAACQAPSARQAEQAARTIELTIPSRDATLAATLHLPAGRPPFPAITGPYGFDPVRADHSLTIAATGERPNFWPQVRDWLVAHGIVFR